MSTLTISNLNDGTTTVPTSYITAGSTKAYSEQDNTGVTINQSLNQSSITDSSTGHKIHTWTSAFTNNKYLLLIGVAGNRGSATSSTRGLMVDGAWTTTAADVRYAYSPASAYDDTQCGMSVLGDLA